jgi:hypothetical protein
VHLTAYQAPAMATWTALVTGVDEEAAAWRWPARRGWPMSLWGRKRARINAVGETAAAALDALEAKLRHTTTEDEAAIRDR